MPKKKVTGYNLDADVIAYVAKVAKSEDRSASYTANRVLRAWMDQTKNTNGKAK